MKHKVLKSVAHNTGHSFVSLMNWRGGDYVMSHITRAALTSGAEELRADLLTGVAEPPELLPEPVRESIHSYATWFPNFLRSHGVEPAAVVSARLTLCLVLRLRAHDPCFRRHLAVPFECVVDLVDDRGRTHTGKVADTWAASLDFPPPAYDVFR